MTVRTDRDLEPLEHIGLAFHVARRFRSEDSENAEGEALLGLLAASQAFDPERGKFSTFAARVIECRLLAVVGRERKRRETSLFLHDEDGNERERPEAAHVTDPGAGVLASQLRAAVASLPARERAVIVLRFWRGATLEETGKVLELSRQQASRVERLALQRLRRKATTPVRFGSTAAKS